MGRIGAFKAFAILVALLWIGDSIWSGADEERQPFPDGAASANERLVFDPPEGGRTEIEARGPRADNGGRTGFWFIRLSDGTKMTGRYEHGFKSGNWVITLPDKRVLYGPMIAGLMHGWFEVDWPSGKKSRMKFHGGRQVSP